MGNLEFTVSGKMLQAIQKDNLFPERLGTEQHVPQSFYSLVSPQHKNLHTHIASNIIHNSPEAEMLSVHQLVKR